MYVLNDSLAKNIQFDYLENLSVTSDTLMQDYYSEMPIRTIAGIITRPQDTNSCYLIAKHTALYGNALKMNYGGEIKLYTLADGKWTSRVL